MKSLIEQFGESLVLLDIISTGCINIIIKEINGQIIA